MARIPVLQICCSRLYVYCSMTTDDVLISDQVFQLNTFLWALQDVPSNSQIKPILREAGYKLRFIEQRVILPKTVAVAGVLEKLTNSRNPSPCKPDLWLTHESDQFDLVIEIKPHSFSKGSSNSRQAIKILIGSLDLADSLAEKQSQLGHVVYATIDSEAACIEKTLDKLACDILDMGVAVAPSAAIGFSIDNKGVTLRSPKPENLPEPADEALSSPATVLQRDEQDSLHPLYFIPWVPGIRDSQDDTLHSEGLDELTRRVLTQVISEVGLAEIPSTLEIDAHSIMSKATLRFFNYWRGDVRTDFMKAVIKIVQNAWKAEFKILKRRKHSLRIELPDADAQDNAIRALENAKPEDRKTNLEGFTKQMRLFD